MQQLAVFIVLVITLHKLGYTRQFESKILIALVGTNFA